MLNMRIIPLEREKYDYYELHYSYDTDYHYTVDVKSTAAEMGMILKREKYAETRHVENTDTLYQDYWTGARAFAVCPDGSDEHIGYVEIATEEWNNRLRMTQLLVKPEYRGKGAGKFLMNFVKELAAEEDYRVIVLETQNCNVPAIDFYLSQGFVFCGGNVYFYSNDDIDDDEVMFEMAYLL